MRYFTFVKSLLAQRTTQNLEEHPMKRDLYQTVTDRIVAQLEAGTLPWVKGWSTSGSMVPMNAVSERAYSGVNVLLYWASAERGWARPRFVTFKQAKEAG